MALPEWRHESVMAERSLEILGLTDGDKVLEGYLGLGGHTEGFLENIGSNGHLWGFEIDSRVAKRAEKRLERFIGRFTVIRGNCRDFDSYLEDAGVSELDRAFFDLGIGYYHLGEGYGMALKKDLPIDFRLSPDTDGSTGVEIIESSSEEELRRLIRDSGEGRFARRIARTIIASRPVRTSGNLARIIEGAVPRKFHKPGVSPAQRIFSHLRSVVNDEMGVLKDLLVKLPKWIRLGGRVAFLCYNSAEFSLVRKHLKGTGCVCPDDSPACICGLSYRYKVLADGERPSDDEIERNPAARSARLAAGELIEKPGNIPAG